MGSNSSKVRAGVGATKVRNFKSRSYVPSVTAAEMVTSTAVVAATKVAAAMVVMSAMVVVVAATMVAAAAAAGAASAVVAAATVVAAAATAAVAGVTAVATGVTVAAAVTWRGLGCVTRGLGCVTRDSWDLRDTPQVLIACITQPGTPPNYVDRKARILVSTKQISVHVASEMRSVRPFHDKCAAIVSLKGDPDLPRNVFVHTCAKHSHVVTSATPLLENLVPTPHQEAQQQQQLQYHERQQQLE